MLRRHILFVADRVIHAIDTVLLPSKRLLRQKLRAPGAVFSGRVFFSLTV